MAIYDFVCNNCGSERFDVHTDWQTAHFNMPKCSICKIGTLVPKFPRSTTFKLVGDNWSKDEYGIKPIKQEKNNEWK